MPTFFISNRTVALCMPMAKRPSRLAITTATALGSASGARQIHEQETGQHHAFQSQRPGDRRTAAALDHDRERGRHDCRQQEDR